MTAERKDDLSTNAYLSNPALSAGLIVAAKRSLKHYEYAKREIREDSASLLVGRAVHAMILEPETFRTRYVVNPFVDRRTSAFKEWESGIVDREILSQEQHVQVESMADSVRNHPLFMGLEKGAAREVSVFWTDEATGLSCKARFDLLSERLGIVADIKSTTDASERNFPRQCFTLGYHVKAQWYARAYKMLTGDVLKGFIFIAVEKDMPYACAFYRVTEQVLSRGETEIGMILVDIRNAEERGEFPGYGCELIELELPAWEA